MHELITHFVEILAKENEEQAQEKMLEQFEQSIEVLLRRLRQLEITVIAQFHVVRNLRSSGEFGGFREFWK